MDIFYYIKHSKLDKIKLFDNFNYYNNERIGIFNKDSITPLIFAINTMNNSIIEFLINKSDYNLCDRYGNYPIHYLVIKNDIRSMIYLLEKKKVDIDVKNNYNETALELAELLRFTEIIKIIETYKRKLYREQLILIRFSKKNSYENKLNNYLFHDSPYELFRNVISYL